MPLDDPVEMPREPPESEVTEMLRMWVPGLPKPQGSKKAMMPRGHRHPIVVESAGADLKIWRKLVKDTAELGMLKRIRIERPNAAKVSILFILKRTLAMGDKPTPLCVVQPDLDKLTRAVLDSLTSHAYADDSQVNALHVEKRTAEPDEETGAIITVYEEALIS